MLIQTSTITKKGQVTIPLFIREKFSFEPKEKVVFVVEKEEVKLKPAPNFFDFRGSIVTTKPFDIKKMREAAKKELAKSYEKTP